MKDIIRFLKISRTHSFWMIAGIILGVVVILANTLLMAISGWFIASMAVSGVSGVAFNYFVPSASIRFLAIVRTVGRYAERLITHEATFKILAELRVWLFKRFIPLAPTALERYSDGDVTGRLRQDVDVLENLYLRIIAPLFTGSFSIIIGLVFIAWFSPESAVAMLIFLLFAGILLPLLVGKFSQKSGIESTILASELRNRVTEGVQGIEELILFGAVERQAQSVELLSQQLISHQKALGQINAFSIAGMTFFSGSAVAVVLFLSTMQVAAAQMASPNLVMLLLFSAALFEAAAQLPTAMHILPAAKKSISRIFELADAPVPIPDPVISANLPTDNGICFKNVFASYLPEKLVLNDVSMSIPAGGRVVLTGSSGIGKSLLIGLLLRFRDYQGSITVGGVEIRDIKKERLMEMVAAVPQHPHLFNGTIWDNISVGNRFADKETIDAALKDSCLDSWIAGLPLGLQTEVGVNGSAVSGGEARRIALARALMKNAPILLLDEPTEGLDSKTEREVVSRLNQRLKNCSNTTLLVVSHRPACTLLGDSAQLYQK